MVGTRERGVMDHSVEIVDTGSRSLVARIIINLWNPKGVMLTAS